MAKLAEQADTEDTPKKRKDTARAAGEGAYYRDGKYHCWRLRVGPRGSQETIGFAKELSAGALKIAVRKEQSRIQNEGEKKKVVDKSSVAYRLDDWFRTKVVPRRDQHTSNTYRAQIVHVKAAIGDVRATEVGAAQAQAVLAHYEAQGLGTWSALKGLQVLCQALRLSKKDLADEGLVVPKTPEGRERVLGEDEFADVLAELYREKEVTTRKGETKAVPIYRERYLVSTILNTGLRVSEALGVVTLTVSLKTGILEVLHQLKWRLDPATGKSVKDPVTGRCGWFLDETKGDDTRKVPLNAEALEAIRAQIAMVEADKAAMGDAYLDSGLLFATSTGWPLREENVLRTLKAVLAAVNSRREADGLAPYAPYTIHDLRRTFGTYLADAEDNIHVVSEILGHSDIETTRKYYAHAQERRLREAGAKVSFGRKAS